MLGHRHKPQQRPVHLLLARKVQKGAPPKRQAGVDAPMYQHLSNSQRIKAYCQPQKHWAEGEILGRRQPVRKQPRGVPWDVVHELLHNVSIDNPWWRNLVD